MPNKVKTLPVWHKYIYLPLITLFIKGHTKPLVIPQAMTATVVYKDQ
ncbi:MAG: hypothetical protein V2B12_02470 [bacterium]